MGGVMKWKTKTAVMAFSAFAFVLFNSAVYAFDFGGLFNVIVQPGSNRPASQTAGTDDGQLTSITIRSEPDAYIYVSDTKQAPDDEVWKDSAYKVLGMTDNKGIYSNRIALKTKSIVVSKYINRSFRQKVFQYTGQSSINAELQ